LTSGDPGRLITVSATDRLSGLMSRLTEDSARLVRSEIQLAKTEVAAQVASFARVAAFGVIAGAIAVLSLFALMLAGIYGLATQFSLWLSALIVFGVMIVFAGIFGALAMRALKKSKGAPVPREAIKEAKLVAEDLREARVGL
jgi:NADH:ubiquinone oxidoreductase subunit 6 (subunit J)